MKQRIFQVHSFDSFLKYYMEQASTENKRKIKSYLIYTCSFATLLTYNMKLMGSHWDTGDRHLYL